jgi:hypothetical protein
MLPFYVEFSGLDPGSDAFLTPWIRGLYVKGFFPDPGSQNHIFDCYNFSFEVKSTIILIELAQIFSIPVQKSEFFAHNSP